MAKKSHQDPPKEPRSSSQIHPLDQKWKGDPDQPAPPDVPPNTKLNVMFNLPVKALKKLMKDHFKTVKQKQKAVEQQQYEAAIEDSRQKLQDDPKTPPETQDPSSLVLITSQSTSTPRLQKLVETYAQAQAKAQAQPPPPTVLLPAQSIQIPLALTHPLKSAALAALLQSKFELIIKDLPTSIPDPPMVAVIPLDPIRMGSNPIPQPGPETLKMLLSTLDDLAQKLNSKPQDLVKALETLLSWYVSPKNAILALQSLRNLAPNVNDFDEYLRALNSSPAIFANPTHQGIDLNPDPDPPIETPTENLSIDPPQEEVPLLLEFPEPPKPPQTNATVVIDDPNQPARIQFPCPSCSALFQFTLPALPRLPNLMSIPCHHCQTDISVLLQPKEPGIDPTSTHVEPALEDPEIHLHLTEPRISDLQLSIHLQTDDPTNIITTGPKFLRPAHPGPPTEPE